MGAVLPAGSVELRLRFEFWKPTRCHEVADTARGALRVFSELRSSEIHGDDVRLQTNTFPLR